MRAKGCIILARNVPMRARPPHVPPKTPAVGALLFTERHETNTTTCMHVVYDKAHHRRRLHRTDHVKVILCS